MNQARHFQQTSIHPTFTLVSGGERAIKGKTGDTGHHGDTMRGANNLGLAVQSITTPVSAFGLPGGDLGVL